MADTKISRRQRNPEAMKENDRRYYERKKEKKEAMTKSEELRPLGLHSSTDQLLLSRMRQMMHFVHGFVISWIIHSNISLKRLKRIIAFVLSKQK
jgi:3-methyladenine DNA glycosylase/8-oxoguanine DNA glycosylase